MGRARSRVDERVMTAPRARQGIHVFHAATSLALLATGFLIQSPELRSYVTGGYGLEILRAHTWLGFAFILGPALALLAFMRPLLADLGRRLRPLDPVSWRKIHTVLSLFLSTLLGGTGLALWPPLDLDAQWLDVTLEVHVVVTWLFLASILVHLVAARRKIWSVLLRPFRADSNPGLEFMMSDEEDD